MMHTHWLIETLFWVAAYLAAGVAWTRLVDARASNGPMTPGVFVVAAVAWLPVLVFVYAEWAVATLKSRRAA